jgi:hypothetical protein
MTDATIGQRLRYLLLVWFIRSSTLGLRWAVGRKVRLCHESYALSMVSYNDAQERPAKVGHRGAVALGDDTIPESSCRQNRLGRFQRCKRNFAPMDGPARRKRTCCHPERRDQTERNQMLPEPNYGLTP